MENIERIKTIIEALLIVSEDGLNREDLQKAIESADAKDIEEGLRLLKEEYAGPGRGFNMSEIAGRCRIVSKPEFMPWISNLYQKDPGRLTGPSLETLAIIAYKQPVTRGEIESIRGVSLGGMLKTLLDKELIQIKGRKEAPGRPLVYGTTEKFLELFGLNSLEDLPALRDFSEEDLEYGKALRKDTVSLEEDRAEESIGEGLSDPGRDSSGESAGTEDIGGEGCVDNASDHDLAEVSGEEETGLRGAPIDDGMQEGAGGEKETV